MAGRNSARYDASSVSYADSREARAVHRQQCDDWHRTHRIRGQPFQIAPIHQLIPVSPKFVPGTIAYSLLQQW